VALVLHQHPQLVALVLLLLQVALVPPLYLADLAVLLLRLHLVLWYHQRQCPELVPDDVPRKDRADAIRQRDSRFFYGAFIIIRSEWTVKRLRAWNTFVRKVFFYIPCPFVAVRLFQRVDNDIAV
jgi:hypothetical protein